MKSLRSSHTLTSGSATGWPCRPDLTIKGAFSFESPSPPLCLKRWFSSFLSFLSLTTSPMPLCTTLCLCLRRTSPSSCDED